MSISPEIRLRPAVEADSANVFSWNGAPDVRAVSVCTAPIAHASHQAWFAARLADPSSLILIVEHGGRAVGVVRFARTERTAVVSIALDPADRGRGAGRRALAAGIAIARDRLAVDVYEAWIDESNEASRRTFAAAGFAREDERRLDDGRTFAIWRRRESGTP